jgi:hypothetical protein
VDADAVLAIGIGVMEYFRPILSVSVLSSRRVVFMTLRVDRRPGLST